MTNKLNPSTIAKIWHNAAYDHDLNLVIPSAQQYLSSSSWSDNTFEKLKTGLDLRLQSAPEFFSRYDYSWVLLRESYSFISEPLYQLTVLDSILGNWVDVPESKRLLPVYNNICARATNIWGLRGSTPRSIPIFQDISFITVPFGWDNLSWLSIGGMLSYIGFDEDGKSSLLEITELDCIEIQKNGPARSERYWRSIGAKTIAGELPCSDLLVPALIESFIKEIHALSGAFIYMAPSAKLTTTLACNQLALIFAIAHEVGHHLSAIHKNTGDGEVSELIADELAFNGLWNSPAVFTPFSNLKSNEDILCILSGYLFFLTYATHLHSIISIEETLYKTSKIKENGISLWRARFNQWKNFSLLLINKKLKNNNYEYTDWKNFKNWFTSFNEVLIYYINSFSLWCNATYPTIIGQARAIHKSEISSEPDIDDRCGVDSRIQKAIEQNKLKIPTKY